MTGKMSSINLKEKPHNSEQTPAETLDATDQWAAEVAVSKDGWELFPQPVSGDIYDPLNWPLVRKHSILAIVMSL